MAGTTAAAVLGEDWAAAGWVEAVKAEAGLAAGATVAAETAAVARAKQFVQ